MKKNFSHLHCKIAAWHVVSLLIKIFFRYERKPFNKIRYNRKKSIDICNEKIESRKIELKEKYTRFNDNND